MKNCWTFIKNFKVATITGATLLTCGFTSAIVLPLVLKHNKFQYNFQQISGEAADLIAKSIDMRYQGKAKVAYDYKVKVAEIKISSFFSELPKSDSSRVIDIAKLSHIILPTTSGGFTPPSGGTEHVYMQGWETINFTIIIDLVNLKCLDCKVSQPIVLLEALASHIDAALIKNKDNIVRALNLLK